MTLPLPRAAGSSTPQPTDRTRRERRNHFAFLSLFMGICAWVPLMILVCGPLSFLFAGLAWMTSQKGRDRGLGAAWAGMFLTVIAALLHTSFALLASLIGWTGALLGIG